MSTTSRETQWIISALEGAQSLERHAAQLRPLPPGVYEEEGISSEEPYSHTGQELRLADLRRRTGRDLPALHGRLAFAEHERLRGNVENFIGMAQVPVGIAGPLLMRGLHAQGLFYVPLATTEGALVASYSRGMKATGLSGGVSAVCLTEGVQRSPYFKFDRLDEAGRFVGWVMGEIAAFERIVSATSRHAKLLDVQPHIEGNSVILTFEYTTGDASGQNMVTICTNAICKDIVSRGPLKPVAWYVESNYSGDKKATALSFSSGRGRKVVCECVLQKDVVATVLKSTADAMADYWQASTLAVVQSGAIGAQGHVANGLAALFIACGQDAACVAESATGITRMQVTDERDLYVSLTLPNIMVGTVGGGTGLPTQRECLELLDCFGEGNAKKLAEIVAATALCGEISIAAALSAGHFSDAHKTLGRK
jgi:hydroxymethylglutaryl-CoA reductase (NADPH)